MFIHRKLTTTCCVAVLALGLVACGSSDDDTSMTDPTTMDPMELAAAEQLANAQAAVADAKTMVAALAADSSPSDRAAAYAALAGAQSVLAEASGIPENEIALLRAEIARLQGDIDKAKLDAQAEADRIAAEMATEATRIAALVAGTASAETKRTAIGAEARIGVATVQPSTYTMTIERDRDGTIVKIVDGAMVGDDDLKFMQVMDLGNGRTMHTRTMDADTDGNVVTEVVIVSTDIEAPTATAFADEYSLDTNPNMAAVNQSHMVGMDNVGKWSSSEFPSTPDTTQRYPRDADAADENAVAIDGKFDGADGTFVCAGMDCSLETDADGELDMVGGTWHFTPDKKVTVDVADADYLNYGFWLQKTTDEDGVLTYNQVQTFAGSSVGSGEITTSITGSATYNGGATGVYVHSEVNSDGSRVATTAGQFAADATLTAIFGQVPVSEADNTGTIAPSLLNTLTGDITNFALEHNEANTWAVNLKGVIQAEENTVDGTAAGSASGGGAPGTFTASFHGAVDDDNDFTVQPSSVVGEFGANFSNGSVAGAFGASK